MLMREEAPDVVAPPNADVPAAETKLKPSGVTSENEAPRDRNSLQEEQVPKSVGLKPSHSMPQSGLRQPEAMERVAPTAKDALARRAEPAADGPAGLAKRRDAFAETADARKNRTAAAPELQRQAAKADTDKKFAPAPAAAPPRVAESAPEQVAPAIGASAGKGENKAAKAAIASADRGGADSAERAQSADMQRSKQLGDAAPPAAKPAPAPREEIAPAAPAASVNKLERTVDLTPDKWLERIEELRKQGKLDEARASLAEFRKRYPDYRLPESLRNGLRE
jgi:hypothetical protein